MLGKLNPFRDKHSNPLDQLSVDELRTARVKLDRGRERILKQIQEMEAQKTTLFEQGVHADPRARRDFAHRLKETEEQVRHLDQQLAFYSKQIQIISRLTFLKDNRAQLTELGIDKLLGKMDTGELRSYVEEISLKGAVNSDRLSELATMLEEALGATVGAEEDVEVVRLMAEMERAALPPETLDIRPLDSASQEPPQAA